MRFEASSATARATVMLVEDDAVLATEVVAALSANGYAAWHAETGADARAVLRHRRPDLILVDLTLPDVDGLVLCTQLRNEAPGVPFMVCSVASTAERVLAFKLGAEDVLPKPFALAELEVRVEAVLRRRKRTEIAPVEPTPMQGPPEPPSSSFSLEGLRVDVAQWRVVLHGAPLQLTPTEFKVLAFLAASHGRIVSRHELAAGVWGDESMSASRNIDAYVRRIRGKLEGARGSRPALTGPRVLSIRGMGYQLATPFVAAA